MLLHEKIAMIRKMNHISQEAFAEALSVSRQAVSKWENGTSIPDVQMLLKIADLYHITLDQLVRDECELTLPWMPSAKEDAEDSCEDALDIQENLGKICDVSMKSLRYNVIRNVKIVGRYKNMVCFIKNKKYGYFNFHKSQGILIKKEEDYSAMNELLPGKCSVYANTGSFFGGATYLFSSIDEIRKDAIVLKTGDFRTVISFDDLSVILMSEKAF